MYSENWGLTFLYWCFPFLSSKEHGGLCRHVWRRFHRGWLCCSVSGWHYSQCTKHSEFFEVIWAGREVPVLTGGNVWWVGDVEAPGILVASTVACGWDQKMSCGHGHRTPRPQARAASPPGSLPHLHLYSSIMANLTGEPNAAGSSLLRSRKAEHCAWMIFV